MKRFAIAVSCVLLFSCHKDNSTPSNGNPPPPNNTGALKISLALPGDTSVTKCELIISEPGVKILLDTLGSAGQVINATLSTNASLVDVATVLRIKQPFSFIPPYLVNIYKAVNPTNWTSVFGAHDPYRTTPAVAADLYFRHAPSSTDVQVYGDYYFTDWTQAGILPSSTGDSVLVPYQQLPGNSTYTVFPTKGVFLSYQPRGLHDTIDCSTVQYDTAVVLGYNSSPAFNFSSSTLSGITDTTNGNTLVGLYEKVNDKKLTTPQLLVPRNAKFQKYLQNAQWLNVATNEQIRLVNYSSTVRNTVDFPAANAYTLSSFQPDNCSIAFNGTKPSLYTLSFGNDSLIFGVNTPPDTTQLNPLALITGLKSKLLQGQNLSTQKPTAVYYINVPGLGYADYLSLMCNQSLWLSKRPPYYIQYQRNF